jgi:hypothetical protein
MAAPARFSTPDRQEWTFDMRDFWRLAIWGGSATAALLVAVVAAYSDAHLRRPMDAANTPSGGSSVPKPQLASRPAELDAETRRLAEAVRILTSGRDQLAVRVDTLERNLEDMTGAINRPAATASTGATVPVPPSGPPSLASSPSAAAPVPAPSKEVAGELAMPPASATPALSPARQQAGGSEPPLSLSPPERVANAPAAVISDGASAAEPPRTEFAVDVGGAVNFEGLRVLWTSTKGSNTALFEGLHPAVVVRENSKTKGAELRLIAGPLANVEAAARLCATLSAARRYCQPVAFEGQRLADADTVPPQRKPAEAPKPRASAPAAKLPRLFQ